MTLDEAEAKWAEKKAEFMAAVALMTHEEKQDLLRRAWVYKSGPDSCNSVYLGSMARVRVVTALGGNSDQSFNEMLKLASSAQLDQALDKAAGVVSYMLKNPVKKCPHCGQVVP